MEGCAIHVNISALINKKRIAERILIHYYHYSVTKLPEFLNVPFPRNMICTLFKLAHHREAIHGDLNQPRAPYLVGLQAG